MTEPVLSSQQYKVSDAFEAIEMCYDNGWTDGLPVVPPTEARVRQFIEYTGRSPDEVIGRVPVRERVITVEKVAINAVMAGCLPQYMPVILAAVEAMCEESYLLHGSSVSGGGGATLLVVNGPIAKELNINSGENLFGPGWRANATIGRALRLILINVCGSVPGGPLDRSSLGHPGKYTYCIAESEADSPWEPYHVEKGFSADTSTVTVFCAFAQRDATNYASKTSDGIILTIANVLVGMGEYSGIAHKGGYSREIGCGMKYCVVIVGFDHRGLLAKEGWTKQQVKEALYQRSQRSLAELKLWGMTPGVVESGDGSRMVPAVSAPEEIMVIAAGGWGLFSTCIAPWGWGFLTYPVTKAVRIPGSK